MKIRLWVSTAVSFCVLFSAPSSFAGLLDNVVKGVGGVKGGGGGGTSSNSALRGDLDRCGKETDEFNRNVEYTTRNGGPDKIGAKLGKPAKIISNEPDYFMAHWPLKNSKSGEVTIEIGCLPDRCEVSCLHTAKAEKGNLFEACKADIEPFAYNVGCNVDNCPQKLEETFGHKAKLSLNEPGNRVSGVLKYSDRQYKSGSAMVDVLIDFSCEKKNCSVGCKLD